MLSLIVLLTSVLVGFVAAQTNSSDTIPSFVDLAMKNSWCTSQNNACPYLCGGPTFTKDTRCVGSDILHYICACTNGSSPPPDIGKYTDTVPNHICLAQFQECRQDNPGSQACKDCPKLDPRNIPASVATSTAGSSSSSASATGTSTATSTSGTAKPNAAARVEGGWAMGALVALGLLL